MLFKKKREGSVFWKGTHWVSFFPETVAQAALATKAIDRSVKLKELKEIKKRIKSF